MFIEIKGNRPGDLPHNLLRAQEFIGAFQKVLEAEQDFYLIHGQRGTPAVSVQQTFRGAGRNPVGPRTLIRLGGILLRKAKPYCGNHPGQCPVDAPRPNSRYLEWDDYIRFNNRLNRFLDDFLQEGETAEAWSTPRDLPIPGTGKREFWIRRNNRARQRWDWEESRRGKQLIRLWNFGSPDQFDPPEE